MNIKLSARNAGNLLKVKKTIPAAGDCELIEDISILWKYLDPIKFSNEIEKLKNLEKHVSLCTSSSAASNFWHILNRKVSGIEVRVIHLLRSLFDDENCLAYLKGGSVRDAILGIDSFDVDLASTCNASMLYDYCKTHFCLNTQKKCKCDFHDFGDVAVVFFGTKIAGAEEVQGIDGHNLYPRFYNYSHLEYSTNSIAHNKIK